MRYDSAPHGDRQPGPLGPGHSWSGAALFVRVRKHARRTGQSMRSLVEEGLRRCLNAERLATGYRLPDLSRVDMA